MAAHKNYFELDATQIFPAFEKVNVLVVGDVMIDRYLTGTIDRISPEAPVPVVLLKESENRLGGAANVALNIKAMGATPYLCSVVGDDENGKLFQELLPKRDIQAKYIVTSTSRKTTVKTRILAQHQHVLRVDSEDTADLTDAEAKDFLKMVREILDAKDIHVILFQDYNKGVLSASIIREVLLEAIKRDIPTAVDPKFNNFWSYQRATLFKPNLKEIRAQLPFPVETSPASLRKASEYIRSKMGNQHTLITLSEKGLYIDNEKRGEVIPTQPRAIADVCGAGDTVISVAALGMALNLNMQQVAALANLAGGQVCERVGVVSVDRAQLQREYELLQTVV